MPVLSRLVVIAMPITGQKTVGSGGRKIIEYNPQTDITITKSAVLPTGTRSLGCAEDSSTHKIYCFGGEASESGNLTNRITEYNPQTDVHNHVVYWTARRFAGIFCMGGTDRSNTSPVFPVLMSMTPLD